MTGELASACMQFEAVVLRQVLTAAGFGRFDRSSATMPDDTGDDEPGSRENATSDDVFGSLIVGALADATSRSGGVGLATELERALAPAASR